MKDTNYDSLENIESTQEENSWRKKKIFMEKIIKLYWNTITKMPVNEEYTVLMDRTRQGTGGDNIAKKLILPKFVYRQWSSTQNTNRFGVVLFCLNLSWFEKSFIKEQRTKNSQDTGAEPAGCLALAETYQGLLQQLAHFGNTNWPMGWIKCPERDPGIYRNVRHHWLVGKGLTI